MLVDRRYSGDEDDDHGRRKLSYYSTSPDSKDRDFRELKIDFRGRETKLWWSRSFCCGVKEKEAMAAAQ